MSAMKETRSDPELRKQFSVPRFIWVMTKTWHSLKGDPIRLRNFWVEQGKVMEAFDVKYPGTNRPPFPDSERPVLPPKPRTVILATGSQPIPSAPAPAETGTSAPAAPNFRVIPMAPAQPKISTLPPTAPIPLAPASPAPFRHDPGPAQISPSTLPPAPAPLERQKFVSPRDLMGSPEPAQRRVSPPALNTTNRFSPLAGMRDMSQFEDEDAEGSDEDPAPVRVDKGKQKEVLFVFERPEAPAPSQIIAKPAPAPKPKAKPIVAQRPAQGKIRYPQEESDDYAYSSTERETEKVRPPAPSQDDKRNRLPENAGIVRTPPCQRCMKAKRTCYAKTGTGYACVSCAKVKMRCQPPDDGTSALPGSSNPNLPAPAQARSNPSLPAPAPAPSKRYNNVDSPAPSNPKVPKKRKVILIPEKEKEPEDVDSPAPAPAPSQRLNKKRPEKTDSSAPGPSQPSKKRKRVETPASQDNDGDERRLPKGRTFADFETFFGNFFFFFKLHYNLRFF
jgi:hypothetical protein